MANNMFAQILELTFMQLCTTLAVFELLIVDQVAWALFYSSKIHNTSGNLGHIKI